MGSPRLRPCSPCSSRSLPVLLAVCLVLQGSSYRGVVCESWASSDATRRTMQGDRGRDTKAELAVRGGGRPTA